MGIYGFFLLVTHYILVLAVHGITLITDRSFSGFSLGVKYGAIAFYLTFGLWLTSAIFRKKFSWDWWKRLHFIAYPIFLLAILHSNIIGTSHQIYESVTYMRSLMIFTFLSIVIMRIARWAGLLKHSHKVVDIKSISNDVKLVTLQPNGKNITPNNGQFAYLQAKRFGQAHPFTVSHVNKQTKQLSFSIKASGDWTRQLHSELAVGDKVFIDGPYGVFTTEIANTRRPVVVVAGGIGITPFLRWAKQGKIDYLFYGNRTLNDIAFKDVLEKNIANLTHVLSDEESTNYEQGYIKTELIKKQTGKTFKKAQYFICGPPVMMNTVENGLRQAGIPDSRIHSERFSL